MDHINESTHRQLVNVADTLAAIIEEMAMETGKPLNYARLSAVNKARDVSRMAKAEARLAGVPMDGGEVTLQANDLPDGTIMVLGPECSFIGNRWTVRSVAAAFVHFWSPTTEEVSIDVGAVQELIDRGVRFELPESTDAR